MGFKYMGPPHTSCVGAGDQRGNEPRLPALLPTEATSIDLSDDIDFVGPLVSELSFAPRTRRPPTPMAGGDQADGIKRTGDEDSRASLPPRNKIIEMIVAVLVGGALLAALYAFGLS